MLVERKKPTACGIELFRDPGELFRDPRRIRNFGVNADCLWAGIESIYDEARRSFPPNHDLPCAMALSLALCVHSMFSLIWS